jgi:hypothetical protein
MLAVYSADVVRPPLTHLLFPELHPQPCGVKTEQLTGQVAARQSTSVVTDVVCTAVDVTVVRANLEDLVDDSIKDKMVVGKVIDVWLEVATDEGGCDGLAVGP